MKNKNLFYALVFILLANVYTKNLYAQCANTSGNPDWCKTGNTVTAAHILGTGNAIPLRIHAGGITPGFERMRILNNNGFVGISTITPVSLLHVDGSNANSNTGEVFRTNAPAGSTAWRMFNSGTERLALFNTNGWNNAADVDINLRASSGNAFIWTNSGASPVATKRMMINSNFDC